MYVLLLTYLQDYIYSMYGNLIVYILLISIGLLAYFLCVYERLIIYMLFIV